MLVGRRRERQVPTGHDRNDGAEINANETTVTELADGRLYFNARNHLGTGPARVHAYSSDGGETLDAPYAGIDEITAPGIQGSVLRVAGERLLLSTPVHPELRRELTVFVSDDAGQAWRPGVVVHKEMAGYSDLVPLPDGQVGVYLDRPFRRIDAVADTRPGLRRHDRRGG